MDSETLIYKLLARALLDIRIACVESDSSAAFQLADLFHNVPYQLARIRSAGGDYKEILDWLEMRSEQKGLSGWLRTAIADCSD
jgi:hypothetical protein